jgi:hypothetical protein
MALIESKILPGTSDIIIEIIYKGSYPVIAGYEYQLREKDSNAILDDRGGDNISSQDDIYHLPTPSQSNIGRRAVVTSNIAALDKNSDYTVIINVYQNKTKTDTLFSYGKVDANGKSALSYDVIKFF